MYDTWLNCLIQAVREFDRRFNLDVETAWRAVMGPWVEMMKASAGP